MSAAAIDTRPTLAELAATANREHGLVRQAETSALMHAILAGEALFQAREACPYGTWHDWLEENFDGSLPLASAYMRIAHYKDRVTGCAGFAEARAFLRGLPPVVDSRPEGHGDVVREQAVALVSEGASYNETAQMLGVSTHSVRRWTNTDYRERELVRMREAQKERRREQAREREAAKERRLKRLANAQGGGIAEAYSLAERMQDALGLAAQQATNPEARAALFEAGTHYRRMRDQIVRALGTS